MLRTIVSETPAKKHEYQAKTVKRTLTNSLHRFDQNANRTQKHLPSIPESLMTKQSTKVNDDGVKGMCLIKDILKKEVLKRSETASIRTTEA